MTTGTTSDTTPTSAAPNGTNGTAHAAPSEAPKEAPKEAAPPKEAPKAARKDDRKGPPPEAPKAEAPKAPVTQPAAASAPEGMRLRMKVWTHPKTGKRYLMPTLQIDSKTGVMSADAMSDEDTLTIKLSPIEWNSLPFFYFKEDGSAPRASARPPDVIR